MTKRKTKPTGSLNSKTPNPFELAYKELWDKLPNWKKNAFAQENADGRCTALHSEFLEDISRRADQLFSAPLPPATKAPLIETDKVYDEFMNGM